MARDEYKQADQQPELYQCPVCGSEAVLWRYAEKVDDPLKYVAMCSNGEVFGPQDGTVNEGCLLYMPPNDFYRPTMRESAKYWNEYAKALETQRRNRNCEKHKSAVFR